MLSKNSVLPWRTHNHVNVIGSWDEQLVLLFRHYLRVHQQDAKEYAQMKIRLAEIYRHDRNTNTNGKEDFFWELMRKANRWSLDVGWS